MSIDESVKILSIYLISANRKFVNILNSSDTYSPKEKKRILAELSLISSQLYKKVEKWSTKTISSYYELGGKEAIKLLNRVVDIEYKFGNADNESSKQLINSFNASFAETISGVNRTGIKLLDKATKTRINAILTNGISNKTLNDIKKDIAVELRKGYVVLKDKSGKRWSLENYSEMLARTKLTEATNVGLQNQLLSKGYDLVMISKHNSDCDLCRPWEGKVLSITGNTKGYPTLEQAQKEGLFHPNCQHRFVPYHEDFAKESERWSINLQRYI